MCHTCNTNIKIACLSGDSRRELDLFIYFFIDLNLFNVNIIYFTVKVAIPI